VQADGFVYGFRSRSVHEHSCRTGWRFPERQITIVVQAAAGGGNDALARLLANQMQKRLGQAVIVENRAGDAAILDQPNRLKLELARKLPSLHDPPPAPSKHLIY
jgi:hypothetical protein